MDEPVARSKAAARSHSRIKTMDASKAPALCPILILRWPSRFRGQDARQNAGSKAKAERGQQGPSAFRASSPLDRPFSPAMLANVVGTAVGVCAGVQVVVGGGLAGVIVVDDVEVLASGAARRQLFLMRV